MLNIPLHLKGDLILSESIKISYSVLLYSILKFSQVKRFFSQMGWDCAV